MRTSAGVGGEDERKFHGPMTQILVYHPVLDLLAASRTFQVAR